MEVLNFYPTHPGDVFFITAGTVHAIGAGNLICEIQQSSNCTYRLYDFDRRDKYGNPRELHLDKALDVLNYKKYEQVEFESEENVDGILLSRCKYFEAKVFDIDGSIDILNDETKFQSIVCIKGEGSVSFMDSVLPIKAGDSVFVPAINGTINVEGRLSVVVSHV